LEHQAGINYETYYKAAKHIAEDERVIYSAGLTYRLNEPLFRASQSQGLPNTEKKLGR
jgi:hypothetical protein